MVSCLLGSSRLFPRLPPDRLWCTSPLQAVFTQPMPVLCLGSDLQSPSLSSQPPPTPAGEQTSLSGWWVLVSTNPLCGNLSNLPSEPLLLCSPPWLQSFPPPPPVSTSEGASYCVETFPPLQLPPRGAGPVPILLCLFFFCPTLVHGEFFAFWEVWGLLPAFSRCSVGVVPHVDVFLMYLWGGSLSPRLTPSPSWGSPLLVHFDVDSKIHTHTHTHTDIYLFIHCILQLQNFCLISFYNFHFFVKLLILFVYIFLFFFKFIYLFIYLSIYLWLYWVFVSVRGLSPVAASGGHSSSRCAGLSLSRPLLLRSTGSRHACSAAVAHGPNCSAACGILPDQGSNPRPLHRQADSQPLRHQGSPVYIFMVSLNCLLVLSCSSLNFLKTANLYYLLGKLKISMSLGLILTAEPKPNGSVADISGVQSCFCDYGWDHVWWFSCLVQACLLKAVLLALGMH